MNNTEILQQERGLSAHDVLQGLRRYGRIIATLTVLGVLVALAWALLQTKVYESTATGVVVASVESDVDSSLAGDTLAKSKVVSYEALAESRAVAERVISTLGLDVTPEELLPRINAAQTTDTVELRITAEADKAEGAIDLAEGWMLALADEVEALEMASQATANSPAAIGVQPLGNASVPEGPVSPNLSRNLPLGGLAGLIVGLIYAVVRFRTDERS